MFEDIKKSAKITLQGSVIKSFSKQLSVYFAFCLFIMSSFVCVWFLIFDTSALTSIGIFDNTYLHISVCTFAIAENMILFFIYLYTKLRTDAYFYNMVFPCEFILSIKTVIKYFSVYLAEKICRAVALLLFFMPCGAVLLFIFKMLETGISKAVFTVFVLSSIVLFPFAVYSYSVFVGKYSMLTFALLFDSDLSVSEIFKLSQELTDGKCKRLHNLKKINLCKKLMCLFVLPSVYLLPYTKILTNELLMENKKPYMQKKAHTEKSVVFYFSPIKEN